MISRRIQDVLKFQVKHAWHWSITGHLSWIQAEIERSSGKKQPCRKTTRFVYFQSALCLRMHAAQTTTKHLLRSKSFHFIHLLFEVRGREPAVAHQTAVAERKILIAFVNGSGFANSSVVVPELLWEFISQEPDLLCDTLDAHSYSIPKQERSW